MTAGPSLALAVVLALLQTAAPYWLGDTLGVVLRARMSEGVSLAVGALLLVVGAVSAVVLFWLGVWNVVTMAVFGLLGLVRAVRAVTWPAAARRLAQVALAALVAEAGVRLLLPAPPGMPWPTKGPFTSALRQEPDARGASWSMMVDACALGWRGEPRPGVLHLGDSVVYGTGVRPAQRFVAHLDADDTVPHVVAASPGVSVDLLLVAARRRLGAEVDQAVLYVDAFNDLSEVDAPLPCCPGGKVLTADLEPSCDEVAPIGPVRAWWLRSAPPFALRIAAEGSVVARWTWVAWAESLRSMPWTIAKLGDDGEEISRVAAIVERFGEEAGALGVIPVVVFLPDLRVVTGTSVDVRGPERHALLRSALDETGVPVIDATPFYVAALDPQALTMDGVHLTVDAHRAFAAWLEPRLRDLRAPRDEPDRLR